MGHQPLASRLSDGLTRAIFSYLTAAFSPDVEGGGEFLIVAPVNRQSSSLLGSQCAVQMVWCPLGNHPRSTPSRGVELPRPTAPMIISTPGSATDQIWNDMQIPKQCRRRAVASVQVVALK